MKFLEEIVFKSSNYQECIHNDISNICIEINKLEANHPDLNLENLTSTLTMLLSNCDTILVDYEKNKAQLNTSLEETEVLACKLNIEKKLSLAGLNNSVQI